MVKQKNILITGGAGFIGSNLVKFILKKNLARKIIILDNYSSGNKINHVTNNKVTYIRGDTKNILTNNFNNFNNNYDVYLLNKHFSIKSNWKIGYPLFSAIIDNKLHYFSIIRDGARFKINHKGAIIDLLVLSGRHLELNKIMIPRKEEDKSNMLLSPMPGLLVSLSVKEGQIVDENEPLAIIEAMKILSPQFSPAVA